MSEQTKRKKNLLDEDVRDGGGPGDYGFRVNKEYAARFEHNKRREELHRLQSKYPEEADKLSRKIAREAAKAAGEAPPEDEDGDSSEFEEEDDGEIPEEVEAKIFDTLLRIRSHDPSIYQKEVEFFKEEDESGSAGSEPAAAKKAKPMYLKDMIAKQALMYGPGGDSSDEEDAGEDRGDGKKRHPKAYDQEQQALRKAFMTAAVEAEDGGSAEEMGGVLRLRAKAQGAGANSDGDNNADENADQDGAREKKLKKSSKLGGKSYGEFQQLIEAYFGSEAELKPDDKFLKEYIMNKGWVDRDDDYVPSYREVIGDDEDDGGDGVDGGGVDDEEDDKYLREMDAFEAKYNFRYEEPGADRIITHPRIIEGTVRKPDDTRKRQRDAKKQRLEEEAEAMREEVKRLKNLKKQEIESKMGKLRSVAGAAAPAATSLDDMLEGDFDPEEWDKKMAVAFNDDYYAVEEDLGDLKDDLDLLGEDMDDDDDDDDGGDGAVRFRTLQRKIKKVDALSEDPEGGEGGAAVDPETVARQRAELQRLLEQYYKLDYEDNIDGIKTRFRYKEVPVNSFGLSVDEILRLDDKKLNQVVGIKRLAPYRDDLSKLRPNYKALEMIKGEIGEAKGQRRQHNKRKWHKGPGSGHQGGQGRYESGGGGNVGDMLAAGVGPGSAEGAAAHDGYKRKASAARSDHDAEPGPSSKAAAGADRRAKKRKHTEGFSEGGRGDVDGDAKLFKRRYEPQQLDPKQARLGSYAVPTLKKEPRSGKASSGKKQKGDDAGTPTDGLTRSQRKNLKRSQKRASKHAPEVGGAAQ